MLCLSQQPQLQAFTRSKSLCRLEQSQSLQSWTRWRSFPYNKAEYRAYSPPHTLLNIVEKDGDYSIEFSKSAVEFMTKEPLLSNASVDDKSDSYKQRHQTMGSSSKHSESFLLSASPRAGTVHEELVSNAVARVVRFDDSNPGESHLPCIISPHVDTDYDRPNNVATIVSSDDLNLRESLLPSRSSTPNASTDYDEAGNLERAVVLGPSGSNPSEFVAVEIVSGDGHNEFDPPHHRTRATSFKVFMLIGLSIEMLSAGFDQVSSPNKPLFAQISLLLAIVALLACIWELVDNVINGRNASPNRMGFGMLPDLLGFGIAFIQCASAAVQYYFHHRHESNPMKLSLVTLFCLFWLVVLKWKN